MNIGDDDEDAGAAIGSGEGQGAEGQNDGSPGGQKADLSAEHADDAEDDGQPEDEVVGKEGDDEDEPKPLTRAQARFQRLANETKAAREEAAAARREAEELRRQSWQRNQQVSEAEKQQRRALMTDAERHEYDMNELRTDLSQQLNQTRMQSAFTADKMAYDARAASHPVYAKHSAEVERRFADQVRKGAPVERQVILQQILGELALNGARTSGPARRAAGERVKSQRVAAGSGKGDAASDRGKAGATPESRLKDVYI